MATKLHNLTNGQDRIFSDNLARVLLQTKPDVWASTRRKRKSKPATETDTSDQED